MFIKKFLQKELIFLFVFSILCAIITGGLFSTWSWSAEKETKIVIIISAKSLFPGKLTPGEIKKLYLGETKFIGKKKVIHINQKDEKILGKFLQTFIGKSAKDYMDYWIKKVFAEGGIGPKVVEGSQEVIKSVAKDDAAIGYVWDNDLTGGEKDIKAVTIEEKK